MHVLAMNDTEINIKNTARFLWIQNTGNERRLWTGGKMRKESIIFGTGKYFENYMACYGLEAGKRPLFAVDNDPSAVGSCKLGVEIKSPEVLRGMAQEEFYVVICCARHEEIGLQLEAMGIRDYHYYKPVPIEDVYDAAAADAPRPYGIGYVPGVFDLFHVGHLNLLRRSKARCDYLIAGVLTDELVEYFKKGVRLCPMRRGQRWWELFRMWTGWFPLIFPIHIKLMHGRSIILTVIFPEMIMVRIGARICSS